MKQMGFRQLKTSSFWIAVFVEFQATMLFVLITTGSAMSLNRSSTLHIALTFGFTIAVFVQAIGHISEGHINPAVTFAMVITKKTPLIKGVFYIIAQCVGAICGSAVLSGITPDNVQGNLAADALQTGVSVGAGFAVEFLVTYQFVLTVFASTDNKRTDLVGSPALMIGLSIAIGHLFAIGYTNCGMNPARSLGPAVVSGYWDYHWIFWIGPILGGSFAGFQYEFFLAPSATPARFREYMSCKTCRAVEPDEQWAVETGIKPEAKP